jgi:hypothetical protein
MKHLVIVEVRGKTHEWGVTTRANDSQIADWRADGLSVIVVENTVPAWAFDFGLGRIWVVVQDIYMLRNPWRKGE